MVWCRSGDATAMIEDEESRLTDDARKRSHSQRAGRGRKASPALPPALTIGLACRVVAY
jgi:hypothetical protein